MLSTLSFHINKISSSDDANVDDLVSELRRISIYSRTPDAILKKNIQTILSKQKVEKEQKEAVVLEKREEMDSTEKRRTFNFDNGPEVHLEDLGGLDEQKAIVQKFIDINVKHSQFYKQMGFDRPLKNILINGPMGSGKTSLALAIANMIGNDFVRLNLYDERLYSSLNDNKIKTFVKLMIKNQPCTIILEDLDHFFGKEGGANKDLERKMSNQLAEFLEETKNLDIFVISTVHKIEKLSGLFARAGRFELQIDLRVPDEIEREKILFKLLKDKKVAEIDIKELAIQTAGFVAADLVNMVHKAAELSIDRYLKDHALNGNEGKVNGAENEENGFAKDDNKDKLKITEIDLLGASRLINPIIKKEGFNMMPSTTWDDIGALRDLKSELEKLIVRPIKEPEMCAKFNIKRQAGVLLYGPPGCGKTMLAKAVANACKANFIYVKGPELLSKYVGDSEKAVRGLFERARLSSPCLIFFDEIDGLCPKRTNEGNQVIERVVNQLLTEMNGLEDLNQIYLVGATNRPDIIDRAILRPERLGIHLYVPLPIFEDRLDILRTIITKRPVDPNFNIDDFSKTHNMDNYSGADLNALVEAAARNAAWSGENRNHINYNDFQVAYSQSKSSISESDIKYYEKLYGTFN